MIDQIRNRLKELKGYKKSGHWADPHNSSYTNGFDHAQTNEILFLENLLSTLPANAFNTVDPLIPSEEMSRIVNVEAMGESILVTGNKKPLLLIHVTQQEYGIKLEMSLGNDMSNHSSVTHRHMEARYFEDDKSN